MSGIRLQDAGHGVAGKVILSGLDLHLTEARIGIVGRNGSGKTTLLRLIAGLVAADAGTVRVDGADPFADRRAALAALGILFQNPDHQILFPTVEEELAFGLAQQGLPATEAAARVAAAALAARGPVVLPARVLELGLGPPVKLAWAAQRRSHKAAAD